MGRGVELKDSFYWSSKRDVLLPVVYKLVYHPWSYKSGFSHDNGHIFNNNKQRLQGSGDKELPEG